ncbi:RING finger and SPRY domain-containing protein 1-like isoform X2 [Leptidea sinapis]|uniref:RING finger and SPRY domain-containing protein 1-like isoform X2 n=1 Tax=Leptidea sinapis TaxID=189913 RepID=UPI0021201E80|nr:RING finger and SPRY domain-containing protein 1-like isoform X2 [Leptidea sinapis]
MGDCCCKSQVPDVFVYTSPPVQLAEPLSDEQYHGPQKVDSALVDQLVLETLSIAASRLDTEEESPVSLMKLHMIADKEEGWIQMMSSMVNVIPVEDPFGPTAISIVLDACPLPSKETVMKLSQIFQLSAQRIRERKYHVSCERNICVILGCLAEKLVGPNSIAMLSESTLEYLFGLLVEAREAGLCLYSLIALEKFAHTMENKIVIKKKFESEKIHPLLKLEEYGNFTENYLWRQVGFCANWALDNLFPIEGRKMSYEIQDMSHINAMLNSHDVSEYLKLSPKGLEARCDSFSFESVRCTFQVDDGCWYYEVMIVTPGVMQIGWATKNSHFLSDEGFGIGDDLYSLSYDGCRRLVWYNAKPTFVTPLLKSWQPGDILGCLIDLTSKEVIFSLNGNRLPAYNDIFETNRYGFYAAASFMAYQQCHFNFGLEPFRYPPDDRLFAAFNDFGELAEDQKKVIPKRVYLEKMRNSSIHEDSCTLCYDDTASCVLEPCGHSSHLQ